MTRRASPWFPSQPFATVEVPAGWPAGDRRVSKIEVGVAPRFQTTCRTPSDVRARPSWFPGWVGPLIRLHAAPAGAARPAPAASAAATAEAATARATNERMSRSSFSATPGRVGGFEDALERDLRQLGGAAHRIRRALELAQDDLVLAHQDRAQVADGLAGLGELAGGGGGALVARRHLRPGHARPEALGDEAASFLSHATERSGRPAAAKDRKTLRNRRCRSAREALEPGGGARVVEHLRVDEAARGAPGRDREQPAAGSLEPAPAELAGVPSAWVGSASAVAELRRAFLHERLDALAEVGARAEQPVGQPFQLEPDRERGVVGVVQHALRGA